ncbi:hypothetical protein INH39_21175 [Massilia violaceinigra]|uniref:DUF2147 domain-containing protein n=1 Tax=Massilia violaceinigra TaxID=2045208 RepID=A0ABY3ZZR4_9BURK|nr:hypothetical protein [Massilia violaceinigra]UOD27981.1 hypothetical protein INH39_21175 [Massilia violaceinigra]
MVKSIILCFALFLTQATYAARLDRHYYGEWKITAVLDSQESTSLSDDEAGRLVGTRLVIAPDRVRFGKADCMHPSFKVAQRRFYPYFVKQYNFEPKKLPLPDKVREITVTCREPVGINFIYVRDREQLVLYWEGYFLNAVKQTR